MTINNLTYSPYGATAPDGVLQAAALDGRNNELLTSDTHGPLYNLAVRGNLFMATTLTAGTTIPIMATNLVSTFTLYNPLGSGRNLVLYKHQLGLSVVTLVASDISLYYQTGVGGATTVPGTLTALSVKNCLLGAGLNTVATVYSAATLVGALNQTGSGGIAKGPTMYSVNATNATAGNAVTLAPTEYRFEGGLILPPGTLVTPAGNAAQTGAMQQTFIWAEVPV